MEVLSLFFERAKRLLMKRVVGGCVCIGMGVFLVGCLSNASGDDKGGSERASARSASVAQEPAASREVELSKTPAPVPTTPMPEPPPAPAPTPVIEEIAPDAPEVSLDPPHDEGSLEVCDRVMKRAMLGNWEGEGEGEILARATPDNIYDVPNSNVAYRTRASTRAKTWRLEYDLHTGDCRHAFSYARVNFAELSSPPHRDGKWSSREEGEYVSRETLEIEGVRAVIKHELGASELVAEMENVELERLKAATRECAEALANSMKNTPPTSPEHP